MTTTNPHLALRDQYETRPGYGWLRLRVDGYGRHYSGEVRVTGPDDTSPVHGTTAPDYRTGCAYCDANVSHSARVHALRTL